MFIFLLFKTEMYINFILFMENIKKFQFLWKNSYMKRYQHDTLLLWPTSITIYEFQSPIYSQWNNNSCIIRCFVCLVITIPSQYTYVSCILLHMPSPELSINAIWVWLDPRASGIYTLLTRSVYVNVLYTNVTWNDMWNVCVLYMTDSEPSTNIIKRSPTWLWMWIVMYVQIWIKMLLSG